MEKRFKILIGLIGFVVFVLITCWPVFAIMALHHYRDKASPELYPAWMAAHPEAKNLTFEQWDKLWRAGLLKSK